MLQCLMSTFLATILFIRDIMETFKSIIIKEYEIPEVKSNVGILMLKISLFAISSTGSSKSVLTSSSPAHVS